jgi:prepilin-type N-terminal cleavage/methylation domain-containing protein/prepilin-type processing-associated H-X9-DG protein
MRNPAIAVGRNRQRYGFTIIELLVVISVIGLLFALLVPALQRARESARNSTCQGNLHQMGAAMLHFAEAKGRLPSGGEGSDFSKNPPATVFDLQSTFTLILPYLSDERFLNTGTNLLYAYNDAACPANQTFSKTSVAILVCPSNPLRLADPNGYGVTDYMPTVYTDIDPTTGFWNPLSRKAGALRLGGTMLAAIKDGQSRTIAVVEDAGRSYETVFPNTVSAFPDPVFSGGNAMVWNGTGEVTYTQWLKAQNLTSGGLPPGDTATPSGHRVMNRWAEPASAGGISGQPNNSAAHLVGPVNGNRGRWGGPPLGSPTSCPWSQTNCGPNEETWSWHLGGANVLYCDGSVRRIGEDILPRVLRMLITADEQDIYDDKMVPK